MKKQLTPADLANPKRTSGYDHVTMALESGSARPKPFQGRHYASGTRRGGGSGNAVVWNGPRRKTALEAAQDYCNYMNSGQASSSPAPLKSPGHKRPQQPRRRVPSDIQAARGMVRDWEAQQRKGVQGYVYLIIEVNSGGGLTYGKIGYSVNPEKRVTELQTANPRPLALLYKMKGTEADEKRLHRKYRKDNVLQEWFRITKPLLLEFPAAGRCDIPSEALAMVLR